MNLIRYILDFFHINGAGSQSVKYAQGHTYPVTDETTAHVEADFAEVVAQDDMQADSEMEQPTPIVIPASMLAASISASSNNPASPSVLAESLQSVSQSPEQPAQLLPQQTAQPAEAAQG